LKHPDGDAYSSKSVEGVELEKEGDGAIIYEPMREGEEARIDTQEPRNRRLAITSYVEQGEGG
jgi:hypothetical protein